MKRFLAWIGIILSCTTASFALEPTYTFGFTGDTGTISISSDTTSPTKILTKEAFVQRTWIINQNNFDIYVSSFSTNFSTSTFFKIPATGGTTNPPVIWSPDGPNAPYAGQMYAVSVPTSTAGKLSIFRSK